MIGKNCGTVSLAAVGTSARPVEAVLCVFLGIGTGVSILISQYYGAGDREKTAGVCRTPSAFVGILLAFSARVPRPFLPGGRRRTVPSVFYAPAQKPAGWTEAKNHSSGPESGSGL